MRRRTVFLVSIAALLVGSGVGCCLLIFSPRMAYQVRLMVCDEEGIERAATILARAKKGRQYLLHILAQSNAVEAKAAVVGLYRSSPEKRPLEPGEVEQIVRALQHKSLSGHEKSMLFAYWMRYELREEDSRWATRLFEAPKPEVRLEAIRLFTKVKGKGATGDAKVVECIKSLPVPLLDQEILVYAPAYKEAYENWLAGKEVNAEFDDSVGEWVLQNLHYLPAQRSEASGDRILNEEEE